MKKIITLTAVTLFVFFINKIQAQVRVGIGVNIGSPVMAHPYYADSYYYYPDWDVYYNVGLRQYVYYTSGNWVRCNQLPVMYNGYDFNNGRRVVINERNPYVRADYYRERYGYRPQVYVDRRYDNRCDNRFDRSRNFRRH